MLRARPKSANFNSPRSEISKFCGLISRCNMDRLWQYSNPRNN